MKEEQKIGFGLVLRAIAKKDDKLEGKLKRKPALI